MTACPPSSFTAAAPPSCSNRPALRIASSATDLIGQERHVGNDQGAAGATAHRSRVVDHHVERDRNGVFEAEHHHSHGIADENNVDSGAIEQSRHRCIVGRQNRNLRACRLHRPKIGDSNRLHGYREYRKKQKTE